MYSPNLTGARIHVTPIAALVPATLIQSPTLPNYTVACKWWSSATRCLLAWHIKILRRSGHAYPNPPFRAHTPTCIVPYPALPHYTGDIIVALVATILTPKH